MLFQIEKKEVAMSKTRKAKITSFLYARPSFLEGVGRVVDFGNALQKYNTSSSSARADERSIRSDWASVGSDMCQVLENTQINHKI